MSDCSQIEKITSNLKYVKRGMTSNLYYITTLAVSQKEKIKTINEAAINFEK